MKTGLYIFISLQLIFAPLMAAAEYTSTIDDGQNLSGMRNKMGALAYMDALPGLQNLAGHDEQMIQELNEQYSMLKKNGTANPTVAQVLDAYKKKSSRTAMVHHNQLNDCLMGSNEISNSSSCDVPMQQAMQLSRTPNSHVAGNNNVIDENLSPADSGTAM